MSCKFQFSKQEEQAVNVIESSQLGIELHPKEAYGYILKFVSNHSAEFIAACFSAIVFPCAIKTSQSIIFFCVRKRNAS